MSSQTRLCVKFALLVTVIDCIDHIDDNCSFAMYCIMAYPHLPINNCCILDKSSIFSY